MKQGIFPYGPKWSVLSRTVAAIIGGYGFVSLMNMLVPLAFLALGQDQGNTLLWTTIASFPLFAVVIMGAFHARSARRAWLWITGLNLLIAAGIFPFWGDIQAR